MNNVKKFRPHCWLFGCDIDSVSQYQCWRCGAWLYTINFVDFGKLDWMRRATDWLKTVTRFDKCQQCGKSLFLHSRWSDDFCSEKCHNEWLPF